MRKQIFALLMVVWLLVAAVAVYAGETAYVHGYVLDPNWYSAHRSGPPPTSGPDLSKTGYTGWGLYEYGAAGNSSDSDATNCGFYGPTNIYGFFTKLNQHGGSYVLASWDTWWRSAYVFNKSITNAFASDAILRLHANMWTYALNWSVPAYEYWQSFVATGKSVTMISFLAPDDSSCKWTVSVHDGSPTGPRLGRAQSVNADGDRRIRWSGYEIQTVPGQLYFVKFVATNSSTGQPRLGELAMNDPIPDLCDPMPGGCAYLEGVPTNTDIALTICSDDDGLLTNMFVDKAETVQGVASAGQTFRARGTSLISFCAWLPDDSATYVATLYNGITNGVPGAQIGRAKRSGVMRSGDPEVMWTWSPGDAPLTPGNNYYIEVTKYGGGTFPILANRWDMYYQGQAYNVRSAMVAWDLSGTIMEEDGAGSAMKPIVQFSTFPSVAVADRGTRTLTVRWQTNVASDSTIEYSAWDCPYTNTYYDSTLTTNHAVTLTGLQPNTMYHYRVKTAASNNYAGITRDLQACTINESPNLLTNPQMEDGTLTANPNRKEITGWSCIGMDWHLENGVYLNANPHTFLNMPPYAGTWSLIGTINGASCDAYVTQRVPATPGVEYNFTLAASSWMQENNTFKYDEWEKQGRLDYMKIGIDPTGGTNPNGINVKYSNRFYSHTHYTQLGTHAVARGNYITVYISCQGFGGQWHHYGIDDCRLSAVPAAITYTAKALDDLKKNSADGFAAEVSNLIITATPAEAGAYYAETEDRTQGIRIESTDSIAAGTKVTVRGTLKIDPQTNERSLISASFTSPSSSSEPESVYMACKNVGGDALGSIPAVPGSLGLHNTGLVIRVAGKVTVKEPSGSYVYVNDGSLPGDGIKVDTSHVSASLVPNANTNAAFTGVSSVCYSGGVKPRVIVRRSSDITPE